jgi:hypothetical protein
LNHIQLTEADSTELQEGFYQERKTPEGGLAETTWTSLALAKVR